MSVKEIYESVLSYDKVKVVELVKAEIDNGTDIEKILNEGLIAAMDEVGRLFSEGERFVPEMLRSAQTMKLGLEVLKPLLASADTQSAGVIVIGTVKGDLHDIGKNLVAMMMEGAGFEVVDLGVDVPVEKFVETAKEKNADVVCLSALLTTTMPAMAEVVKAINDAGLECKTMIGGAPVTQEYADEIGASGFSADAAGAVELARELAD